MHEPHIKRSPFFYVGDKYKLMPQLLKYFPKDIDTFYEPFTGGGTVFLNTKAKNYVLNDIDKNLIGIHKYLAKFSDSPEKFYSKAEVVIEKYNLSRSYKEDIVPNSLKKKWQKTYFARFNKDGYDKLRLGVNKYKDNDPLTLYLLLIYGFNRMLRFNGGGKFNLPVGNVDFNKNVVKALDAYFLFSRLHKVSFTSVDFKKFFENVEFTKKDFVYLDPPYLIASSEYNKIWPIEKEKELLDILDWLNKTGVKFALSNVTHYNGNSNKLLITWMKGYRAHPILSNYINYHNNTKKQIREVLVTNY